MSSNKSRNVGFSVKQGDRGQVPTVGIGMPVFNGEAYLAVAISSILSQTFEDFELVISDNGSSDGTEDICRSFAAADPRIRYIRQPKNLGASWNFNHVFHVSRCKYYKWAAHDDMMAPEFLERCVEVLESDRKCVLVHPVAVLVDENGDQKSCYLDTMASDSDDPVRRFERWMIPALGQCNPAYGLMPKEVVEKTGLMGNFMGSDRIFLGEIAILGQVRMLRETLFLRRVHANMSTKVNVDNLSLLEWFSGEKTRGLHFKRLRQIQEFIRAIRRSGLSRMEQMGCYRVLAKWVWCLRIQIARELMIPLYMNGQPTALNLRLKRHFGLSAVR
jgi:glycosyltransferase involved in cell wall biosynthesis